MPLGGLAVVLWALSDGQTKTATPLLAALREGFAGSFFEGNQKAFLIGRKGQREEVQSLKSKV